MECTVERVTPFTPLDPDPDREPKAISLAAVTVGMGPVRLTARLMRDVKDDKMWLSMPGRRMGNEKWFDYVKFRDDSVKKEIEKRAIELYNTQN